MKTKNVRAQDLDGTYDRFSSKVIKEGDGCWLWGAAKKNNGYGYFRVSAKVGMISSHRAAWIFAAHRAIPDGMYVCHSCDNRACCNPLHLWLGTAKQNQQDMAKKGRVYSYAKRLSNSDKEEIRRERSLGIGRGVLEHKYKVNPSHISRICCAGE